MSKVVKVSMEPIGSNDVFNYVFARCNFCQKESGIKETIYKDSLQLGHGYFYCPFCIRNRFNYKKREHILLMDFRGIIGFYVNYLYEEGKIYNSQIIDYVRKHSIVGLKNPVFSYNHESMLWFIDFTRVGQDKHKISIDSVIDTTNNIIQSFDVAKNVKNCNPQKILDKYEDSIREFYKSRKRPEGKRILSPTLKNCAYRSQIDWDTTKNFQLDMDIIDLIPVGGNGLKVEQYIQELKEPALEELKVMVKQRKSKGVLIGYQGCVEIPGMSVSKLSAKDGTTLFPTSRAVLTLANKMAKKLGLKLKIDSYEPKHSAT
jgi:hypothetical protein